jgi:hypothetical protein
MIVIFILRNWKIGVLFIVVAGVSAVRHYINVVVAIEETGNMDLVDGVDEAERWAEKSRLSGIVEKITKDSSRSVWVAVLVSFGFMFITLFLGAIGTTSTEAAQTLQYIYLDDFYYPPMPDDMRYPTCTLEKLNDKFPPNSTLADYAYLAGLAYKSIEITQCELDGWFTNTKAKDDKDTVTQFRNGTNNQDSPGKRI